MAVLKVKRISAQDWTELPTPSAISVSIMDIDSENSVRVSDGTMSRDVIATKKSVDVSWPALSLSEIYTILNAIKTTPETESTYFFNLYFPDPSNSSSTIYNTGTFYVGDRTSPVFNLSNNTNKPWSGLSCKFIEK